MGLKKFDEALVLGVERLGMIGGEKDRILGALHNRVAGWGAGLLDYHFGFAWGGFRRYALRQRQLARGHFREYLEKDSFDKKILP